MIALRHSLILAVALVIAGAMIAGSIFFSFERFSSNTVAAIQSRAAPERTPAPASESEPTVDVANVSLDGVPFIGDPSAPVVMAYWYDYQCPYCHQVELDVMPRLIADYVETGKLRIYFKDYQFLGPDSKAAALAGRAVWEVAPDRFYDWHRAVFEHQDNENAGWGNDDDIMALTTTIAGIDADKVEALLSTKAEAYERAIEDDLAEGGGMGISGTPGTIIGSELISGAGAYTKFRAAVDAALRS